MQETLFHLQYAMDTFYFAVCGILVFWMAAGFAMLEAGLVRSKNTVEILIKNIGLFATSCTMYLLCGYAVMYGGNLLLTGIGHVDVADTLSKFADQTRVSEQAIYANAADFFFQVMFAATAMSIVSGVVAERMKLWPFLVFAGFMTAVIYPLEGAWTWNGVDVFGWYNLDALGFSDFAGSGVVHLAGASAALAAVLLLGPRRGKFGPKGQITPIPGANLPLATLGTFILWMGWFGFNAGSVLKLSDITSANTVAVVLLNTNVAAAGGLIAALVTARLVFGKSDLTMALNGALAGLVAITAEATTPTAFQAWLIGVAGGAIVVFAILGFDKWRIDDPVGALSVHGVVGVFGLLVVPLTNPAVTFLGQIIGALTIFFWVFPVSLAIWFMLKKTVGIRVAAEEELQGSDLTECGMEAYPEFTNK